MRATSKVLLNTSAILVKLLCYILHPLFIFIYDELYETNTCILAGKIISEQRVPPGFLRFPRSSPLVFPANVCRGW